ncbi:MAG: HD domain-containing protein [Lachnospiraceae bacterium]|nr:HD domain-containing protein [Lachnospiraceae bacterium]
MGVKIFAVIDIGSYELVLRIYQITEQKLKLLDCVQYRLDLGRDTYTDKRISIDKMNNLCGQLLKFKGIMEGYQVERYRVCATSALRETDNSRLVLEQIKNRTGIQVEVLSNTEQRFLEYKALATREENFNKIIQKETAVADIGGGSLQMSLFDKERLIATRNMRLGAIRIKERLEEFSYQPVKYSAMIEEWVENDLEAFKRLYLQNMKIQNLIVTGEITSRLVRAISFKDEFLSSTQYLDFYDRTIDRSPEHLGRELGMSSDYSQMIYPVMVLLQRIIQKTGAKTLWAPGTHLCDGIAYDYAVSKRLIKETHDFEEDIRAAANHISRRFLCNKTHTDKVGNYAVLIFDAMKKVHGLGRRERLLLELIAMLHDCGKYISLAYAPQSSYNIIMSTEIIGLSQLEREIVANTILYNTLEMTNQERLLQKLGEKAYLTVYKLTAILRIANGLDRSHKQKINKMKPVLKNGELLIRVEAGEEIAMERQIFAEKAEYFEEVFGVKPYLKVKNIWKP